MAKLSYADQLKHPSWQRRRLERLDISNFTCEVCKSREKTLHVHHIQYFRGRMAWEYEDRELEVLCEDCHATAHDDEDVLKGLIVEIGSSACLAVLCGYAKGVGFISDDLHAKASGVITQRNLLMEARAGLVGGVCELLPTKCLNELMSFVRHVDTTSGAPAADRSEYLFPLKETREEADGGSERYL